MSRRAFALLVLSAVILPTTGLHAQSRAVAGGWEFARGYRLASGEFDPVADRAREAKVLDAAMSLDPSPFVRREPFGPSWQWQSGRDGPVVAFESLGSSRRGRPRLVHVALDWQF